MKVEVISVPLKNTNFDVLHFGSGKKNLVIIAGVSITRVCSQPEAVLLSVATSYEDLARDFNIYLVERKYDITTDYSIYEMACDLKEVLAYLKLEKTILYGVSQGGMIALNLSLMAPNLVESLVLCSTAFKADENLKEVAWVWYDLAIKEEVVNLNRSFFKEVYSKSYLEKYESILPVLEKQGTKEELKRFSYLVKALFDFDLSNEISNIKVPTLVIADLNDQVIKVENAYALANKLNAKLLIYENYSHAVYDEASDIKLKIKEFLLGEINE